jgi:hypothetical protein
MTPERFYKGLLIMVFDPVLWDRNGGDSKTDSFMRKAEVQKVYMSEGALFVDVVFEHDGRLSKGHYANMTEEIHAIPSRD